MFSIALLLALVQQSAPQEEPVAGLVGQYYLVGRRTALPEQPEGPARFKRVDSEIRFEKTFGNFPGTKLRDGLYVTWRGLIRISRDGTYVFLTRSDDGSRVWIDGKRVVDNDGAHEMQEEDGDVELKAGLHEIRIDYFNNIGHNGITLYWKGPEIEKEVVPAKVLSHRKRDEPSTDQLKGIELPAPETAERDEPRREGDRERRDGATVTGEVLKVDERTIALLIRRDGGRTEERVLILGDEAEVVIDGEKAKLAQVGAGRMARVLVRRETAVRIELPRIKGGERNREGERPVEKAPAKPPVVEEAVIDKGVKPPDLGGRVLSVFEDGATTLVTIRQGGSDVVFYIPKDAAVSYVGIEKQDQKPTEGYLATVWLKPGSKDMAATVRFAPAK